MTKSPILSMPADILEKIFKPLFYAPEFRIRSTQWYAFRAVISYQPPLSIMRTSKQVADTVKRALRSSMQDGRLLMDSHDASPLSPHALSFLKQYRRPLRIPPSLFNSRLAPYRDACTSCQYQRTRFGLCVFDGQRPLSHRSGNTRHGRLRAWPILVAAMADSKFARGRTDSQGSVLLTERTRNRIQNHNACRLLTASETYTRKLTIALLWSHPNIEQVVTVHWPAGTIAHKRCL